MRFSLAPWMWFVLVLYAGSILVPGLGTAQVLSRHEVLAAQPAREMLHGATWVHQSIAGEPRLNKTPAYSWVVATFMLLTGSQDEWVPRLTSVLAGIGAVLLMAHLAARHFGPWTGLLTGLFMASSYWILRQARLCEADMTLTLCVIAAVLGFARHVTPGPTQTPVGTRACLQFGLFAGLAMLLKGPIGPAVAYGAAVVYTLIWRDRRGLRFLLTPFTWAPFLLVSASWYVLAALTVPGIVEVWQRETLGRATGQMAAYMPGVRPWHFYLWAVPLLLLPWTLLLPFGLHEATRLRAWRWPIVRLLICWTAPGLLLLSTLAWKHFHYAMPVIPPLCLLLAAGFVAWVRTAYASVPRYFAARLLWSIACGAGIVAVLIVVRDARFEIAGILAVVLVGGLVVLRMEQHHHPRLQIAALFGTAWLGAVGANVLILPYHDGYRPFADLGRHASATAPPDTPILLVGLREAHVSYYLRLPIARIDRIEDVARLPPGTHWLIINTDLLEQLSAFGQVEPKSDPARRPRRIDPEFVDIQLVTLTK